MTTTEAELSITSGLDLLRAIRDGRFPAPPAAKLLDLDLVEADEGRTLFSFVPTEAHLNPAGGVHGGILAAIADFAVATAIMTTLPVDANVVTTNLDVTFVRGVAPTTGRLWCEGRAVHVGRTLAHAEATLTDVHDQLYVRATATCRVRRAAPPAPTLPG